MDESRLFDVFSEEQQKEYEEEAYQRWASRCASRTKSGNSLYPEQKAAIGREGEETTVKSGAYVRRAR